MIGRDASVSEQLWERRRQLGLTLAEAARRAGTSPPTLSRYEHGWTRFEMRTLRKLASALDCDLVVALRPRPDGVCARDGAAAVRRLARLFWDHPFSAADLKAHPVWTVERVLEYGNLEDVRALRGMMGAAPFLDAVAQARLASPKTRQFWKVLLELEGRTCTRTFSRDIPWNC